MDKGHTRWISLCCSEVFASKVWLPPDSSVSDTGADTCPPTDERGFMKRLGRMVVATVGAASILGLSAGTAFAHECFNASRAAEANTVIAEHSHGWFDIQTWQLYSIFVGTPCAADCPPVPADVQPLLDAEKGGTLDPGTVMGVILGFAPPAALGTDTTVQAAFTALVADMQVAAEDAACLGVPTHYLTLNNATAAGGAPQKVTTNNKGIDHFPDVYGDQLFQAYGNVYPAFSATPDCTA